MDPRANLNRARHHLKVGKVATGVVYPLAPADPGTLCATRYRGRTFLRAALALLLLAGVRSASAQFIPGLVAKPEVAMFGTLPTNVTPNYSYYGPVVSGYSLGGFLQTRELIGAEIRGSIQRRMNAQHQEALLGGPRLALHYGRISPYVDLLGGIGNGWRYLNPPVKGQVQPQPVEGAGPQWTILGGADFKMSHHLGFRLGELSYSKVYLKNWSLTPLNISAGVVYRLN